MFVTGQQEVHSLCAKLQRTFPFYGDEHNDDEEDSDVDSKCKLKLPPKVKLDE